MGAWHIFSHYLHCVASGILWCWLGRVCRHTMIHHWMVCFWRIHWYRGNAKTRIRFPSLPLRQNITSCHQPASRLFEYDAYLLSLVSLNQSCLFMRTTSILFNFLQILSLMSGRNTEIDCYYIWEADDDKTITLPHVTKDLYIVDIFTKASPRVKHQSFVSKLMLVDSPTSIWEEDRSQGQSFNFLGKSYSLNRFYV